MISLDTDKLKNISNMIYVKEDIDRFPTGVAAGRRA